MKKIKFILVFIALILVFINVYWPHINYTYPLHMDEWQHIAQSEQIIDKGGLINKNPYFPDKEEIDFELGFHIFLSQFFLLTGLDPILNYQFLPAIFAVLAALALFMFLFRITNFWTALFSILFFSVLPSNVNILGLIFFVPLTLGIFFIYLFFFLFKINKKIIASIFLLTLFLIHPISGIVLLPFIIFYCLTNINIKEYIKKYKLIIISSSIVFLLLIFLFKDFIFELIQLLIFREGWGLIEIKYPLPSLYGKLNIALALFGVFIGFRNKLKDFVLWLTFILGLIYLFHYFEFTILVPYQRLLYYIMIGFVPLSAIGLYSLLKLLFKFKINKNLIKVFSIIIACLLLFFVFYEFSKFISPHTDLYHIIDEEDYSAIKWLSNYPNNIVLAPIFMSSTIYPISKNYVVAITTAKLGLERYTKDPELFFNGNCNLKTRIIEKHNVNFIFSRKRIDCENLEEVYNKNNYIYKVT